MFWEDLGQRWLWESKMGLKDFFDIPEKIGKIMISYGKSKKSEEILGKSGFGVWGVWGGHFY